MPRKSDKEHSKGYLSRNKKRRFTGNRYTFEQDVSIASTSAKKLVEGNDEDIEVTRTHGYRFVDFFSVFTAISQLIECKVCHKDIKFTETSVRGLGFKIGVQCECNVTYINSCPLISNAYEINRRIVCVMRLLGIGNKGLNLFCGLMDLAKEFYSNTYYAGLENLYTASKAVFEFSTNLAMDEEKRSTFEKEKSNIHLTVSGDGTWKKRGFSSLIGVATLIGKYTNKAIDVVIKCSYCKMCEMWEKKIDDEEEYDEWKRNHQNQCSVNHEGSAGKMEVDGISEMFSRSMQRYGAMYTRYIGDGDSKTYKGIVDLNPYDVQVKKLECVLHVKKRMGSRLRAEKKKHKGIGGKGPGKLTDKLINDLTAYYGLAITRHTDSVEEMKNAIWATYHHKCSTDTAPEHDYCPTGADSWCSWRRAEAKGALDNYTHDPPLTELVQQVIKPIYTNLSQHELIERCLVGNTQNNNESFNQLIWHFTPNIYTLGQKQLK